ncbi:5-hydroxytryptamine receptor 3A [Hoplias malabaricus]|uniref:5-hydroxytryptamine receptor 3A n=1 Tax=Hoplias malabaricus TaxID=27720 RepID=UPI00346272E7
MSSNKGIVRTQLTNCSYQSVQEYLGLDKDNIKMTSLRPVHHWKTPTLVLLDLYVSSITEVNEKAQTFSPHIYVEMGWVNEFTKWNATDFCGITFMSVPKEMLWIPDITVMEIIRTEFSTNEAPFLKMLSEGFVNGGQAFTLTSVCKMDLYRFPFDTQSCTLTLQSSLHTIEEFHIEAYSNASSLTAHSKEFFVNKGEWELISINMSKSFIESSGRVWDQLIYTVLIPSYIVILCGTVMVLL